MLVGGENMGWSLIVNQLNHERIALMSVGPLGRMLEETRQWAQATRLADGRRVIDQQWVQLNLARVRAKWEVLRLLNWRQAWCMTNGGVNFADASTVKVFASEFYVEAYRALMEVIGQRSLIKRDSPGAVLARPPRDALPHRPHPHLRRRHQRGAARHHRHGGAADAAVDPMTRRAGT